MPLKTLSFAPGVTTEATESLNRAGISAAQLIRWESTTGLPQKVGGWTMLPNGEVAGIPRELWPWADLNDNVWLAVGTDESLVALEYGGGRYPITPQQEVANVNPIDFSTTVGSTDVIVGDVGSNASIFDIIWLQTQVSVGGLVLYGPYQVSAAIGADSYRIQSAVNATATVANGGATPVFSSTAGDYQINVLLNDHGYSAGDTFPVLVPTNVGGMSEPLEGFYAVEEVIDANNFTIFAGHVAPGAGVQAMNSNQPRIVYHITPGPEPEGGGYGTGGYGIGGYGTGLALPTHSGTPITASDWTMGNWGSVLFACPFEGPIYTWTPLGGLNVAAPILEAPLSCTGIFTAMPEQILVAYGCEELGIHDQLLVRWCHPGNYHLWTADTDNLAGKFRLGSGHRIVSGMQGPGRAYLWTDTSLWSMTFVGGTAVFAFDEIGINCGLIGQQAEGTLGDATYWMGSNQFHVMTSSVATVPCTVWDAVFQNLNTEYITDIGDPAYGRRYSYKVRCWVNSLFNEVWWFYPSRGSPENDRYVKFTVTPDGMVWDNGVLARSAVADKSVIPYPLAATSDGTNGVVYAHEVTHADADGNPYLASFTTGYVRLDDGDELMFVDWLLPDMKYGLFEQAETAGLTVDFYVRDYPNQTPRQYTATFDASTPFTGLRFRGREVAMKVSSFDTAFWRLGGLTYRAAPSGGR